MEGNLKTLSFEVQKPAEILLVLAGRTTDSWSVPSTQGPNGFCGPHSAIGQQGIDSGNPVKSRMICVIENSEGETFAVRPNYSGGHIGAPLNSTPLNFLTAPIKRIFPILTDYASHVGTFL